MSSRVYFSKKVQELPGFKTDPHLDGSAKLSLNGIRLSEEDGELYYGSYTEIFLPQELEEFVERISVQDSFSASRCDRETGIYQHKSAEAEVEFNHNGERDPRYMISIKAKKLSDAYALLRKIKTGTIRPVESYEGEQQGQPRRDFEEKILDVRTFLYALECIQIWPFCTKAGVARKIKKILDNGLAK